MSKLIRDPKTSEALIREIYLPHADFLHRYGGPLPEDHVETTSIFRVRCLKTDNFTKSALVLMREIAHNGEPVAVTLNEQGADAVRTCSKLTPPDDRSPELVILINDAPNIPELPKCEVPQDPKEVFPITQQQAFQYVAYRTINRVYSSSVLEDPFPFCVSLWMLHEPEDNWNNRLRDEAATLSEFYDMGGDCTLKEPTPAQINMSDFEKNVVRHLLAYYLLKGAPRQLELSLKKRVAAFRTKIGEKGKQEVHDRFPTNYALFSRVGATGTLKNSFVRLFYQESPPPKSVLSLTQELTRCAGIHTFILACEFALDTLTLAHAFPAIRTEVEGLRAARRLYLGGEGDVPPTTELQRGWPAAFGINIPPQRTFRECAALAVFLLQVEARPGKDYSNYAGVVEKGQAKFRPFAREVFRSGPTFQHLLRPLPGDDHPQARVLPVDK